jgi:DNA-binding NtrC family response regulator
VGLRALRFEGHSPAKASKVDLNTGSTDALAQILLGSERPLAYVIRNEDLDEFRQLGPMVVDRGRKDGRKGLWALVGGYEEIPLIDTPYRAVGQVRRGVRDLLTNARAKKEKNLYVIGVVSDLFEELWDGRISEVKASIKRSAKSAGRERVWTSQVLSAKCLLSALPRKDIPDELRRTRYLGESPHVELVRLLVMKAADGDFPVLIVGPTGSGKENVARAIHELGKRKGLPFVSVNTAAIASTLFESELFGAKKGAYTDSKEDRPGLWVSARGGTLLLDEIGDLHLDLQAKILRALEENEVRPVGGVDPVSVQARVIAATNRDLFAMVRAGHFREDLYYRLRDFRIETPPLRDHPEDIPALARFLWRKQVTKDEQADLSDEIVTALQGYGWPGNVRELRSVLTQLYAAFEHLDPTIHELRLAVALQGQESPAFFGPPDERELILHRVECLRHLRRADEAIQACHATLRPIVDDHRTDPATVDAVHAALHYRLIELERLCQTPLLFHGELTFEVVERFTRNLADLHRQLERSPAEARRYWESQVARDLKLALSAIFKQVSQLIGDS